MDAARDELAERLLHHRAWLAALARALTRSAADADDVVQATWTAALAHPPQGPLRPWLATVARRLAGLARRGDAHRRAREERAARPEALPASDALAERLELEERLVHELRGLAEPLRATLVLRYQEGLSAAEIARREGVPEGTVRWRCKRGLDELRGRLEGACGGREGLALALLPIARRSGVPFGGALTGGILAMGKWGLVAGAAAIVGLVGARAWQRNGAELLEAPRETGVSVAAAVPAETTVVTSGAPEEARREPSVAQAGTANARGRLLVLESDRTALADALVAWRGQGDDEVVGARTDAQGWVDLPAGAGACELLVRRPSAFVYRGRIERGEGELGRDVRELLLPDEPVLEGRILVDGTAPSRPLWLELVPDRGPDVAFPHSTGDALADLADELTVVRTDAAGRFVVRGAHADQGYVLRLPTGYVLPGTKDPSFRARFDVTRVQRGLVLEVEHFRGIQGRLLEADGRTPTAGIVECRFTWANGTDMLSGARADEDGWFELFPEPGEEWRAVDLEYWGGVPGVRGRNKASFERERVGADWMLGDLVLARGRTLDLYVSDPDERAIPDAHTDLGSAPTDALGVTRLVDVTAQEVRIVARGFHERRVPVPADADELRVVLEPAPELFLRVRDVHGVPVGRLAVELSAREWLYDAPSPSSLLSTEREGRHAVTYHDPFRALYELDERGLLRVDSLRSGVPFALRVLAGGGHEVYTEELLALLEDERRELPIELPYELRRLRGRVRDDRGEPVAGARLELAAIRAGGTTFPRSARTGKDGRFDVPLLDLGELSVIVRHAEHLPFERAFPGVPSDELDVVLERGHAVAVTVVDADGRPRPEGTLTVLGANVAAAGPGRYTVTGLAPGPHAFALQIGGATFRASHESHVPELVIRVPALGAVEVRWDVGPVAEDDFVHCALWDAEGEPVLSAGFHDMPAGVHRFEPVVPGTYEAVVYQYTATDEHAVLARAAVTVVAGETVTTTLRTGR